MMSLIWSILLCFFVLIVFLDYALPALDRWVETHKSRPRPNQSRVEPPYSLPRYECVGCRVVFEHSAS